MSSISPLSSTLSALLTSSTTASNTSGAASNSSALANISKEILAEIGTSQGSTGSGGLLQDLVTLSSTSDDSGSPLYNAQGLLSQLQSNMMLNDPLLQSDNSTSTGIDPDLLSSLLSLSTPTLPAASTGTTDATGDSDSSDNSSAGSDSTSDTGASDTAADKLDVNSLWTQVIKDNPAMAATLLKSQLDQNLISDI